MLSCFSRVCLFVTLWTVAYQAPLFIGFSRQEYWSGLPSPPPGNLPNPRIECMSLSLLHWQVGSLPLVPPGILYVCVYKIIPSHIWESLSHTQKAKELRLDVTFWDQGKGPHTLGSCCDLLTRKYAACFCLVMEADNCNSVFTKWFCCLSPDQIFSFYLIYKNINQCRLSLTAREFKQEERSL